MRERVSVILLLLMLGVVGASYGEMGPAAIDYGCYLTACTSDCTETEWGHYHCSVFAAAKHYTDKGQPLPLTVTAHAECKADFNGCTQERSRDGYGRASVSADCWFYTPGSWPCFDIWSFCSCSD